MTDPSLEKHSDEDSEMRDELARDRAEMANERTLLAYVRTAIAFLAAGAALLHFFPTRAWLQILGFAFIAAGLLVAGGGVVRFAQQKRRMRRFRKIIKAHERGL